MNVAKQNGRPRFYGKYRGTVIDNLDPLRQGRIQAIVPDVSQLQPTSWALPCVTNAGRSSGTYMVPQIGSGVWIEFEQGDPDYPIWVGGYWGSNSEVPGEAMTGILHNMVIQTQLQHRIVLSDLPGLGGIRLETTSGAKIEITDIGITLDNGKGASIMLLGPTVKINDTALVVT